MPKIFTTLDKIKPAYDVTYKVVLFICKLLLIADIFITTMSVIGRYVPFIPDPRMDRRGRPDLHELHGRAECRSGHPPRRTHPDDRI
ncbi:hypothetical protein AB2427_14210 [Faecalibacterium prausnitzii]|uniref:hypothetical protein n=1 Tax=Faecalibacterium prausnitzii TaxID=853 RepID=UPI003EBC2CAA